MPRGADTEALARAIDRRAKQHVRRTRQFARATVVRLRPLKVELDSGRVLEEAEDFDLAASAEAFRGKVEVGDTALLAVESDDWTLFEWIVDDPTLPAAEDVAATVAAHEAATTEVHGIEDTSALVLTDDSRLSDMRTPTNVSVTAAKVEPSYRRALGRPPRPTSVAEWFTPPGSSAAGTACAQAFETATPWWLPDALSVDRIAIQVTTAAASGVVRLGFRAATSEGYPGTLLYDAGTVDASTTGVKETGTFAVQTLGPGLVWLSATVQGANGVFLLGHTSPFTIGGSTATLALGNYYAFYATGVSGALPASFGSLNYWNAAVRMAVRAVGVY